VACVVRGDPEHEELVMLLPLVGRDGMHPYNNQDHSMLAAMTAVDNIIAGVRGRENLWALSAEQG
jgi:hypothetical protein